MKQLKRLYFILSYVLFILPPFIWGLVELYAERPRLEIHVISLIVNVIVLAVLVGLSYLLIYFKKLHRPNSLEMKYLLFGLTGNTVVYFYTFQNMMNIDKYVTVYLILLIVLLVHYFLISKKITEWELWILLPLYLFFDTIHLILWGCPVTNSYGCLENNINPGLLYLIYAPMVALIFGYYGYKIYQYKRRDFYGLSNIVLVTILILILQINPDIDEKVIGTLGIAIAFLVILNFIVSIVNKTYDNRILLHYVRTSTLLMLAFIMAEEGFFKGEADPSMLIFMVVTTYVSLGLVILKYLLHVDDAAVTLNRSFRIVEITEEYRLSIKEGYGDVAYNHLSMEEDSYTVIALINNDIVGFISTVTKQLPKPLEEKKEAYINIIEVHENHRRKGIATKLLKQSEQHFRKEGYPQLRGWSSTDKTEAIHLWNSLGYLLSPTTVYYKDRNISVDGFYFVKKL